MQSLSPRPAPASSAGVYSAPSPHATQVPAHDVRLIVSSPPASSPASAHASQRVSSRPSAANNNNIPDRDNGECGLNEQEGNRLSASPIPADVVRAIERIHREERDAELAEQLYREEMRQERHLNRKRDKEKNREKDRKRDRDQEKTEGRGDRESHRRSRHVRHGVGRGDDAYGERKAQYDNEEEEEEEEEDDDVPRDGYASPQSIGE